MKHIILLLLIPLSSLFSQDAERPIGINLASLSPWDSQMLFVDLMKQSHPFMVQDSTGIEWEIEDIQYPSRIDGYPTVVPFYVNDSAYRVHTILAADHAYLYPSGEYTFIFDGTGEIELTWDISDTTVTASNNAHLLDVSPSSDGIHLTILSSDSADPIHNIRMIMPGYETSYENQPFHPLALERLDMFEMIRFMKPLIVEETAIESWDLRTPKTYSTQWNLTGGGMAPDYISELCNYLGKDAWINLPYAADDNFVHQFARFLNDSLDQDLKIYIEYCNESWNPTYDSYYYTQIQGLNVNLDTDTTLAGLKYHVLRSIQIFDIFSEEFDDNSRLVNVIASQGAVSQTQMEATVDQLINPGDTPIHALAIAPYFGWDLVTEMHGDGRVDTVTTEAFLDLLTVAMPEEAAEVIIANAALAESYNVDLISYEGGQGVEGNDLSPENFINVFAEANRHPRMGEIYCDYYDLWYSNGGRMHTVFNIVSRYDRYGAYGLLEHFEQDVTTAPKWMAHVDCIFDTTTLDMDTQQIAKPRSFVLLQNFPNPFNPGTTIKFRLDQTSIVSLMIYDVQGREIRALTNENYNAGWHEILWDGKDSRGFNVSTGIYFAKIKTNIHTDFIKMLYLN